MDTWEEAFGVPVFVNAGESGPAHIVLMQVPMPSHDRPHPETTLLTRDGSVMISCKAQVQHPTDELGVNHALAHCLGLLHSDTGMTQWPTESGASVSREDAAAVLSAMGLAH